MSSLIAWINALQAHQVVLLGTVVAAIVGALGNVLTGLVRDFVAKAWFDRRDAERSADEVFRRYAEPIGSASTDLYWRLKEILQRDGRASFLMSIEPRTEFDQYKLRSTYYRLAVVLGWRRALRRELSFLRSNGEQRVGAIDAALAEFECALADGHHVELRRLHGLMDLWRLRRIEDKNVELRVAVAVEQCMKHALQASPVVTVYELDEEAQAQLCLDVARVISSEGNSPTVPAEVLQETQSRSIQQIAVREAWLYRDWQTAIGDMMIRETKIGDRNFEVLGYGEFEEILLAPSNTQFRSLCRLVKLFEKVDLDRDDPFDARPELIRSLFKATARMIVAIADAPGSHSAVDTGSIADARNSLESMTIR